MAKYELPTPDQAYDALCRDGDFFAGYEDVSVETPLTYEHPRKGTRNIHIDPRALSACTVVYANGEALTDALYEHGAQEVAPADEAIGAIDGYLSDDPQEMIWGVSGFASAGNRYVAEAQLMRKFFTELAYKNCEPSLVVNGGLRTGMLGLSSLIAKDFDIPTLGFAPLQGLGTIAPNNLLIGGPTYMSRQMLVGSAADVMTVWGGREGTLQECEIAVDRGVCILLMNAREYEDEDVPNTFYKSGKLREAYGEGQLVIYNHAENNLSEKIDEVRAAALARPFSRVLRRAIFPRLLKKLM
jgi:hypothetical protein